MFILFLIITFLVFLYAKFYLHRRRLLKYVQHLPITKELPLIGVAYRFIGKTNTIELDKEVPRLIVLVDLGESKRLHLQKITCDFLYMGYQSIDRRKFEIRHGYYKNIMKELIYLCEIATHPSRNWLGPTLLINVSSAQDMQTILNSPHCLQKPYVYDFIGDSVGLFSAKVHIWKPSRKLLNPTFNHKILSSFIPTFNERTKIMVDNLEQLVGRKEPFDISKQFFALTLEMVCATTLGVNLDFQNKKNVDVLECMERYTEVIAKRMVRLWLHPDFIFKRTKLGALTTRLYNTVMRLPLKVRKIKEKEFNESKLRPKEKTNDDDSFKEPQIFVNELLQLKSAGLIDERMVDDQIMTIIASGNETSALTASHIILMLAIHQDVQERVFQEIKSVHSNQYSDTDGEVMSKLTYLEMVIRESMRLFPVTPFLARECMEDVKISNCTVPKNAIIVLAFYILHRDTSVWGPNADQFNPEHFLPEKMASRHPYSYLPFSGGPRNCIGIKYAWMSMKVMISALLRRYKFTTDIKFEDIVTKWDLSLKLANRHLVRIERRIY